MKKILLTFDVEEFDLPRSRGNPLKKEKEFELSRKGLLLILDLLGKYNIKAIFFVTAEFVKQYPLLIKTISKNHEIACHGYYHADSYLKDLSKILLAKQDIEKITKKIIKGFRAPRFQIKNISELSKFGFEYDSSIHPTYVPGRYINIFKRRKPHKIGKIKEIPLSTLPFFRLPIFWLAFKNLPLLYSKLFSRINFLSSDYTMLIFHTWEFADLDRFDIPRYIKKNSGNKLINMIEKYILFCKKKGYGFETIENYLNKRII